MAGAQIEFLLTPYVSQNGSPLSGGTVEFFIAGTSTPVTVYADKDLVTPLGTSVTLDSRGVALAFGTGNEFLKIVVKDDEGNTLQTFDGLSYQGGLSDSGLYYLRDGSLPLTGDMTVAGYDFINTGNINVGVSKHININHGHSYTPIGSDQIVYGDSNGVFRQFQLSGKSYCYKSASQLFNVDETLFQSIVDFELPGLTMTGTIDMGSNKITDVADGTVATDAATYGQLTTSSGTVQGELDDTQLGAGLNPDGSYPGRSGTNYLDASSTLFNDGTLLDAQLGTTTTNAANTQSELDTTQTGAGLNADGTYTPNAIANYINTATSLQNADNLLDTQIKTNEDAIALNTTHRTSAGTDHSDVVLNNTHRTTFGSDPHYTKLVRGRTVVYAAAAATGDGTGRDASNEISYANLLGADGLLSSGGAFDVILDSTTVNTAGDTYIIGGTDVRIKCSAATTFSDTMIIDNAKVEFVKDTSDSESYNVVLSSGIEMSNNMTLNTFANLTINGTNNEGVGISAVYNCDLICAGVLTVANDIECFWEVVFRVGTSISLTSYVTFDFSSHIFCIGAISIDFELSLSHHSHITCASFTAGDLVDVSFDSSIQCRSTTLTISSGGANVQNDSLLTAPGNITITGNVGIWDLSYITSLAALTITGDLNVRDKSFTSSVTRSVSGTETVDHTDGSYAEPGNMLPFTTYTIGNDIASTSAAESATLTMANMHSTDRDLVINLHSHVPGYLLHGTFRRAEGSAVWHYALAAMGTLDGFAGNGTAINGSFTPAVAYTNLDLVNGLCNIRVKVGALNTAGTHSITIQVKNNTDASVGAIVSAVGSTTSLS